MRQVTPLTTGAILPELEIYTFREFHVCKEFMRDTCCTIRMKTLVVVSGLPSETVSLHLNYKNKVCIPVRRILYIHITEAGDSISHIAGTHTSARIHIIVPHNYWRRVYTRH